MNKKSFCFWILVIIFFLFFPSIFYGQTTSVTAQIIDSDGIQWANAQWKVQFYPNPNQTNQCQYQLNGQSLCSNAWKSYLQQNGTTDSSGNLSVTLLDNTQINPSGSKWVWTIQSNTSAPATFYSPIVISGASQNLTTFLSSNSQAPRFAALTINSYGYNDTEVSPTPTNGNSYFNVTNQNTRYWNGSTFVTLPNTASNNTWTGVQTNKIKDPPENYTGGNWGLSASWISNWLSTSYNVTHSPSTSSGWYDDLFPANLQIANFNSPGVNFASPTWGASGHGQNVPFSYNWTSRNQNFNLVGWGANWNSPGDSGQYDTFWDQGATVLNADDEGHFHQNFNGGEQGGVYGGTITSSGNYFLNLTCTEGCPILDTQLNEYMNGYAGAGRVMIDTQITQAHIQSVTSASGLIPGIATIDGTVGVSTAWGLLTSNCGPSAVTNPVGTGTVTVTCNVNLNGITAFGNSPGNFVAGNYVDFSGQFPECAQITSVGGSSPNVTITLNLNKPHQNGSVVMSGGAACTYMDLLVNRGVNGRNSTVLKYPINILGSISSNQLVNELFFRSNNSNTTSINSSDNGALSLNITPFLVSLSNTAGTVSMSLNNGVSKYPSWNGQDIYISNATDSTFNGLCTNFNYFAATNTATCSQASSTGHTSASASAALNCTSLGIGCTANQWGNGDFILWKGAEVWDIRNPNNNNLPDGTYVKLEPNPWTWSNGTTVEEWHSPGMQYAEHKATIWIANKIYDSSVGLNETVSGDGWGMPWDHSTDALTGQYSGSVIISLNNANAFSKYAYWGGGSWIPPDGFDENGPVLHGFAMNYAPFFNQPLLYAGCPGLANGKGGCTDPNYFYYAFGLASDTGGNNALIDGLIFSPHNHTFTDSNTFNRIGITWKFGILQQNCGGSNYCGVIDSSFQVGGGAKIPTTDQTTSTANDIVIYANSSGKLNDLNVSIDDVARYCGTVTFVASTTSPSKSCSVILGTSSHCSATWVGTDVSGGALGATTALNSVTLTAATANSGTAAIYCSNN